MSGEQHCDDIYDNDTNEGRLLNSFRRIDQEYDENEGDSVEETDDDDDDDDDNAMVDDEAQRDDDNYTASMLGRLGRLVQSASRKGHHEANPPGTKYVLLGVIELHLKPAQKVKGNQKEIGEGRTLHFISRVRPRGQRRTQLQVDLMIGKRYRLSGGEIALCAFIGSFKVQHGHRYFSVFYLLNNDHTVVVVPFQDVIMPVVVSDADDAADDASLATKLAFEFVRKLPGSFIPKYFKPVVMQQERRRKANNQKRTSAMECDQDDELVNELRSMVQFLQDQLSEKERQLSEERRRSSMMMAMNGGGPAYGNRFGNMGDGFYGGYQCNYNQTYNHGGSAHSGRYYARDHRFYPNEEDDLENYSGHRTPRHQEYSQCQVIHGNDTHYHNHYHIHGSRPPQLAFREMGYKHKQRQLLHSNNKKTRFHHN